MPYIPYTDEQKQLASSVDLPTFLRMRGEKLVPVGREFKLVYHDGYQRGVSTSTNGGQGYLSIISDNGTMPIATMYRGDVSKKCVPEYNGAVPHSEFTLRAVSETYNSTYTCYGEMQTIE